MSWKHVRQLGCGAYGQVYQVTNGTLHLALKSFHHSSDLPLDFVREANILRLAGSHRHIVSFYGCELFSPQVGILLELAECNLVEMVRSRRAIDVCEFARQLSSGCSHLHSLKIMHRDLKPDNVLVVNNQLRISDFGLARVADTERAWTLEVVTLWYRAPELLKGIRRYDDKIDTWSLGLCILFMIRGDIPFRGDSVRHQLELIENALVTRPTCGAAYLVGTHSLGDVVMSLLHVDPVRRLSSSTLHERLSYRQPSQIFLKRKRSERASL